jgi:hypothetical protein
MVVYELWKTEIPPCIYIPQFLSIKQKTTTTQRGRADEPALFVLEQTLEKKFGFCAEFPHARKKCGRIKAWKETSTTFLSRKIDE